jgi:phytoene desaturase
MKSKKKCVVIGGGLAGLAVAAQLSKQGYLVTLLEKNTTLGGRARVFKKKGFTFDMGPSWYMMPEVIESFFTSLGKKTKEYYTLRELRTKYRVFSDSHSPLDIVSSIEENYKTFEKISPGVSVPLRKIIAKTSVAYNLSIELLSRKYSNVFELLTPSSIQKGLQLLLLFNPFQSYESFIIKRISHPLIQKILQFHTVFLGGSPKKTPALYSILLASDFKGKIWYPLGGVGMLVSALEKICNEFGVHIHTGIEVTSVEIDEKSHRITEVVTASSRFEADIVVNTADYAYFDTQVIPSKYAEYPASYWDSREYAISSVLVYLGLSKKIPELQHHNFYFQDDWNNHFSTIQDTEKFPDKPCYYISAPSVTDPSVAPKGSENLFVLIPLSVKTQKNDVAAYVETVLEHIEDTTGAQIRDTIVYKKIFSQNDFTIDYNAYKGNALGISHALQQSVFLRPRMKSKKVENLFFCGQFTQPGIGVPMVLLSAQYALKEIESYSYRT